MESSRIYPDVLKKKPKVVLDRRFKFFDALRVGESGQLQATVVLRAVDLVKDEVGSERQLMKLSIEEAQIAEIKETRDKDSKNTKIN